MSLSDVPEEGSPSSSSSSPRPMNIPLGPSPAPPSSRASSASVRKPSSLRALVHRSNSSSDVPTVGTNTTTTANTTSGHHFGHGHGLGSISGGDLRASKRNASTSSLNAVVPQKSSSSHKPPGSVATTNSSSSAGATPQKLRHNPRLPHDPDIALSPATVMYWSRAPVYGAIPMRGMRAHSVTLVDTVAWVFGGCDDKDCWKDVYCFDTETMQWTHPDTCGDIPPPCRAHTATLVDRKIVVFGGGQGPTYYNTVYILDTVSRRWTRPKFAPPDPPPTPAPEPGSGRETPTPSSPHPTKEKDPEPGEPEEPEAPPAAPVFPAPRRAHTAVLYHNKIWVFGGGNGMTALNDVWTLDVGVPMDRMRWEEVETRGRKPLPRGYHTANLVGNVMVVLGGSDGKECFGDIWCLNLDTLVWSSVKLRDLHRRLSHTATQVGSYLFIVGGHDGNEYTSEVLLFNLAVSLQYEARPINGKPPTPRGYHAAILADSRLFVFGGFNGHTVYDDVYILDLAASAYLPQVTSFRIDG